MLERLHEGPGPVVFISDAHLGASAGPPERAAWLVRFLESLRGRIGGLLIVGDLFDFWFEYRHAIPKGHFRVCRAIADIAREGVPCLYFGGNHDFWAGTYLEEEIGLSVAQEPRSIEVQGRRVYVAHGDGLGKGDGGYKLLKTILRNRLCIALYRGVHPDIGIPFAYRVSAVSRRHTEPREVLLPKLVRDIAGPALRGGHDAVVIGHIHDPAHVRLPEGEFFVIGDWIENFTYLEMVEGRISLKRWLPEGGSKTLAAESEPPGV
ncbi:MAG: UDP-2,3-diacylglucosamine diphosphatase [Candidatus Eisenbacteria bacterium]|nr:UDP-2,3-diacylglucosamine diphosphatase [Candidatus Eisenbacteria bacterium]